MLCNLPAYACEKDSAPFAISLAHACYKRLRAQAKQPFIMKKLLALAVILCLGQDP